MYCVLGLGLGRRMSVMVMVCLLLATAGGTALADVGTPVYLYVRQTDENGEEVDSVQKWYLDYPNPGVSETCYHDQPWCVTTSTGTRIIHKHLDTDVNGDLTQVQRERANRWYEKHIAGAKSENRLADASCVYNCFSYVFGDTGVMLGANYRSYYGTDYRIVPLGSPDVAAGAICDHYGRHTSIAVEVDVVENPPYADITVIKKVRQKCYLYGIYVSGPNDFPLSNPMEGQFGPIQWCAVRNE